MGLIDCAVCGEPCFPAACCSEHLPAWEAGWKAGYQLGYDDSKLGDPPWRLWDIGALEAWAKENGNGQND